MATGTVVALVDPGYMAYAAAQFTRPADVIAYVAGDAISDSTSAPTVRTFTALARIPGGAGYIKKALLKTDQSTNVSAFRLHLYHTAPSPINDNAPQTLLYADRAKYLASIDFPALATEAGAGQTAAQSQSNALSIPFVCDATDQNLYGLLEVITAGFTPASGQNFYIELYADQY